MIEMDSEPITLASIMQNKFTTKLKVVKISFPLDED